MVSCVGSLTTSSMWVVNHIAYAFEFWIYYLVIGWPLARDSLLAQLVKNLPAVQETPVRSLGWEDPLEKGMATHSSTLAWRIPQTEEPGGLQSVRSQSRMRLSLSLWAVINLSGPQLPLCKLRIIAIQILVRLK